MVTSVIKQVASRLKRSPQPLTHLPDRDGARCNQRRMLWIRVYDGSVEQALSIFAAATDKTLQRRGEKANAPFGPHDVVSAPTDAVIQCHLTDTESQSG